MKHISLLQSKKNFAKKCLIFFSSLLLLYILFHLAKNKSDLQKFKQYVNLDNILLRNKSESVNVEYDETVLSEDTLEVLKDKLKCSRRSFESSIYQRGDYWVLKNFVKADHGHLDCYSMVTFVTHGDFMYMDNLVILIQKWLAPVSFSLYAPGTDMAATVSAIRYVRDCSTHKDLIRQWVTFHIFFHQDHTPEQIPRADELFNCSNASPSRSNASNTYKAQKSLLYPVNVARNIGRDAALTHYFLSLDVELYPIPRLGARFLNMLARNTSLVQDGHPKVFVMKPFEVRADQNVPENKSLLLQMLKEQRAIPFHQSLCPDCHNAPHADKWMQQGQTDFMEVTGVGKRTGKFKSWEPLFISTHSIPHLEERLSWDGKRDKMTQTYVLCVLNYDFMVLSNAFVTHHPGIKTYVPDIKRDNIVAQQTHFIDHILKKELTLLYGTREGCIL